MKKKSHFKFSFVFGYINNVYNNSRYDCRMGKNDVSKYSQFNN